MRNARTRRAVLGLLTAAGLTAAISGSAATLSIELPGASVDPLGRLVALAGEEVVLRAAGSAGEGPYRWSCRPEGGGDVLLGEGEEWRPELSIGVHEVSLEAAGETARTVVVVRATPLVVVGGWAGGLDREAIAVLKTDYDAGYREDVLDPLAGDTLTPNAWLDLFGRRSLRSGYASLVAQVIAETRYRTGVPEVDVVAFGAAGLAVRWLARNQAPAGIRRIVSVGTPGHGTDLASPSPRALEYRAGLVAGGRLAGILSGPGPKDGPELLEMSDRLAEHLPKDMASERIAASLVALSNPELAPHSPFLAALNGHDGMLPRAGERPSWAPPELVLAGSWGRTATHVHVPVRGTEAGVAVARLAAGDRVTNAASEGWGAGAVAVEKLSYLDLYLGNPALQPAVLGFLRNPRPGSPPAAPSPPAPVGRAAQILFADGQGYYPPYPQKWDFGVEASARSLVLTFSSSSAKLGLNAGARGRRGLRKIFPTSPGVETVDGPGVVEIHVARPQVGGWVAEVVGEKGSGFYSVSGTYETTTYLGAGVSASSVRPGEPVTVYGYAVQPNRNPLLPGPPGITVKVWLGEEGVDVPVFDDGGHGDGEGDDGLYAGTFPGTEKPGTYLVTVEGQLQDGRQPVYRWAYERFAVEALPDLSVVGRVLVCDVSPRAGEPFGVAALVENRGDADAAGAVVELLEEGAPSGSRLLARDVVDVAAGGDAEARFFVELPAGAHHLLLRVSALEGLLERGYDDNSERLTVEVAGSGPAPAAAAPADLAILSPPDGARIGGRKVVVTVRAAGPELEAVEVSFDGRPAGSCEAGGRSELHCHVAAVARGKKLRVAAVARYAGGGTVRREARYTLERRAPKLRLGEEPKRHRLSYEIRSRRGAGELLAVAPDRWTRAAAGQLVLEEDPGTEVLLYAADRACNLARRTYVAKWSAEILSDGFETGLDAWHVVGKPPSNG